MLPQQAELPLTRPPSAGTFVRAGYPRGFPRTDYFPLLALLRRQLSDDEVAVVARALAGRGELDVETADIGAAITGITDELPSPADVDRVQRSLVLHDRLEALTRSIADMCGLAGAAMQQAIQALLQADIGLAQTVISDHECLVTRAAQTESDAFRLLALQAPVAGGLRTVLSCMKSVADVGRMGVLALHVAKIARRRHPAHALPEEVNGYFAEMGRIAVSIGDSAKDVVQLGIPAKQPNSPAMTTPWTLYTASYLPFSWTINGPISSAPPSTRHPRCQRR